MSAPIRGPRKLDALRNHPTQWTGYIDPLPADDIANPTADGEKLASVSSIKGVDSIGVSRDGCLHRAR